MAARQSLLVSVATDDDLDELEAALRAGDVEGVIVDIPEDASVFLTAGDFRRVMRAASVSGAQVEFATEDPLRREFATVLGAPLTAIRGPERSASDDVTRRIGVAVRTPIIIHRPSESEDEPETSYADGLADSTPSFSFVITPPVTRRPAAASREPERDDWNEQAARRRSSPRRHAAPQRRRRILATIAAVGSLLGAAALVVGLLLPAATVTLVPAVRQIEIEVTYGLASATSSYDISFQPISVSTTLTFGASIATTGERFEPDGTAAGELLLTNPTTSDVTLPAGTEFAGDDGVSFVTVTDITVPAADPFGTLTFGTASVEIAALTPGPAGNVDAQTIHGQLENGVFYSNREPVTGGTNRRIQVVSQADIDALKAQANSDLLGRATRELATKLSSGQTLVSGSEQRQPISMKFDHTTGSDASSVRLDATLTVSGLAYNIDAMHAAARNQAAQRLTALTDPHVVVLAETVHLGDPQPIDGAAPPAFRLRATARTQAVIEPASVASLKSELTGKSEPDASRIASMVPGIDRALVEIDPAWLPRRMPLLASRITVQVGEPTFDATIPETPDSTSGP